MSNNTLSLAMAEINEKDQEIAELHAQLVNEKTRTGRWLNESLRLQRLLNMITSDNGRAQYLPQDYVAQQVVLRGYRGNWTAEQFAARQVVKRLEELAEEAACYALPVVDCGWEGKSNLAELIAVAGAVARKAFDDESIWLGCGVIDSEKAMQEAADGLVVDFCKADALAEMSGGPFDLSEAAVRKAARDVHRGKRNGTD